MTSIGNYTDNPCVNQIEQHPFCVNCKFGAPTFVFWLSRFLEENPENPLGQTLSSSEALLTGASGDATTLPTNGIGQQPGINWSQVHCITDILDVHVIHLLRPVKAAVSSL